MATTPDWHPARYLASLYSNPNERVVLDALFGIESEIVASLQGGLDHNVAHIRLQWWREECERTAQGKPVHPLTRALAAAGASSLDGLSGFVDTAVWDLANATFETRREVTAYCERWATAMVVTAGTHTWSRADAPLAPAPGDNPAPDDAPLRATPGAASARAASARAAPPRAAWLAIGAAMHEIEMLVNLASEAQSGRLRVPLDELERASVEPERLATPPWPSELTAILAARHEALRAQLARGVADVAGADQLIVRGLLVWTALAWRRSIRAQHALPGLARASRLETVADGWLAWRAARRATNGSFKLP